MGCDGHECVGSLHAQRPTAGSGLPSRRPRACQACVRSRERRLWPNSRSAIAIRTPGVDAGAGTGTSGSVWSVARRLREERPEHTTEQPDNTAASHRALQLAASGLDAGTAFVALACVGRALAPSPFVVCEWWRTAVLAMAEACRTDD